MGHIWRVGLGTRIGIWDAHRVINSPTVKIRTRKGHVLLNKMDELIDPFLAQWDEALIISIFLFFYHKRILRISLNDHMT